MKKNNLCSLSAPAIGYDKRIFCVDFKDSEIKTFINPILTQVKGLSLSKESCTSIPGKQFIRPRNTDLTIIYQRPLGQIETRQVTGMAAFVIQHEIDHLDGLLLSDIGLEVDADFDKATEEEREEIINMYLDSLDLKQKNLQKIIDDVRLKANNNSERQAYINIREYDITANSENTEYVLNQLFEKGIISKGETDGKGHINCIFSK